MSRELYDEIGDRLEKEDWEKYDMLQGDFLGDGTTHTQPLLKLGSPTTHK